MRYVICLCCLMFSTSAFSYNMYRQCDYGLTTMTWPNPTVQFFIRSSDFNNSLVSAIQSAANQYQQAPGTNLDFNVATATQTVGYGNGRNEIYVNWQSTGGALARGYYSSANFCDNSNNGNFIEGDIEFSPVVLPGTTAVRWTTNFADTHNSNFPMHIGPVAVHEFGHFAGSWGGSLTSNGGNTPGGNPAFHENRKLATMNQFFPVGGYVGGNRSNQLGKGLFQPLPDEGAMIRVLYPSSNDNRNDVAGTRFLPPVGGSTVYRGNDNILNVATITRGGGYFIPYHLLNLGNQQRDVRVDFYMTQDGNLNLSGDIQLEHQGSPIFHTYTMRANGTDPDTAYPANNPAERQGSIYFEIPNDGSLFPSGSNWQFGFVVSHVSNVSDWQPNNNNVLYTRVYTID